MCLTEFLGQFEVTCEVYVRVWALFIQDGEMIVASCWHVSVAILPKWLSLFLVSDEKYQTNFYILGKDNTSRYGNRGIFESTWVIPYIELMFYNPTFRLVHV